MTTTKVEAAKVEAKESKGSKPGVDAPGTMVEVPEPLAPEGYELVKKPVQRVVVPPVTTDADGYPLPLKLPGDEGTVRECLSALARLTDVGSLATVLGAVASRCKTMRVRPDVVAAVLK